MVVSVFDLFSIGIGPSSSHTVGPMRAANQFIQALRSQLRSNSTYCLKVTLYGSLAATGRGHGTHQAIILGVLEQQPETLNPDEIDRYLDSVEQSGELLLSAGQKLRFSSADIHEELIVLPYHPNGMRFQAFDEIEQEILNKVYFSVGGGFVDEEGVEKNSPQKDDDNEFSFSSAEQLLAICREKNLTIAQLMRTRELQHITEQTVHKKLGEIWTVMQACVERGFTQQGVLPGKLKVKRRAAKLFRDLSDNKDLGDSDPLQVMDWVNLYALSVSEENAAGGRVVTAPTNGAAGIIPAVLHYYRDFVKSYSDEGVEEFLLTAAAIGSLYKMNASISGAEVGCQGEVGSACSMAAAGLTAVLGGTLGQIEYAAEIAMEHNLGLTCDPVEGLVQVPCIERNAIASVKAINASRMALQSNGEHCVSLDDVIKTMRETGRDMSQKYKETATGGLAVEVPVRIIEC